MDIYDMYQATLWVKKYVVDTNLSNRYLDLIRVLGNNSIEQTNEYAKSLISSLETLEKQLSELTEAQKTFLQSMEILNYIGNKGINLVNSLINSRYESGHEKREAMDASLSKIDNIRKAFAEYNFGDLAKPDQNQVRMNVHFQGNADITNFSDLKEWSDTWYMIARGFAGAQNAAPEDIKIIGASRGSLILDLIVNTGTAERISIATLAIFASIERVYKIKLQAAQIKNLKLQNEKITADLEKEAETEKTAAIKKLVDDQIAKSGLKKDSEGDKVTNFENAIEKLFEFHNKGGRVESLPPPTEEDTDDSYAQIRENTENIKSLENQIKQIENKLKQIANEQQGTLSPPQKDQEPNETNDSENKIDL